MLRQGGAPIWSGLTVKTGENCPNYGISFPGNFGQDPSELLHVFLVGRHFLTFSKPCMFEFQVFLYMCLIILREFVEKAFNRFNNVQYHSVVEPVENLFHNLTCA